MESMLKLAAMVMNWGMYGFLAAWVVGAVGVLAIMQTNLWTERKPQVRELLKRYSLGVSLVSVAAFVVFVQWGFAAVDIKLPDVPVPPKGFLQANLPTEFGNWRGQHRDLDPKTFAWSEAYDAESRACRDGTWNISLLVGLYNNPKHAVYHTPLNCYRGQGWALKEDRSVPLRIENRPEIPEIPVRLTTWSKQGPEGMQKVMVMFWYETGEWIPREDGNEQGEDGKSARGVWQSQVIYQRINLLRYHWAMRGRKEVPPMFKVMMEVDGNDPAQAQEKLLDLGQRVRQWIVDLPDGWNRTAPAAQTPTPTNP